MQVGATEETRGCPPLTAAIGRAASLCTGAAAMLAQPQSAPEAAAAPFLRCARLLLEAGASPLQASRDGATAVHAAAEAGFLPGLQLLLGWQAGGDNSNGLDAMDVDSSDSVGGGSSALAPLLEAADNAGRSPLARAAAAGRAAHDCILFLLSRGAEVTSAELVRVISHG